MKNKIQLEIDCHQNSAKNAPVELIGNPEQFNFTKGEWIAERKSEYQTCHLVKTGDKYTVHVYDSKYGIDESESWGNAVLISKAPELLNILIKVLKHIKDDELEEISHFPMIGEAYKLIEKIKNK